MYEERLRFHAIADKAAVAASIERKKIAGDHDCDVPRIETRQNTENCGLRNLSAMLSTRPKAIELGRESALKTSKRM